MASEGIPDELVRLVEKMQADYTASELEIAQALAAADGPLTIDELVDELGYTERTIKKRVGTLEDQLGGSPLFQRDDDGRPYLHAEVAAALNAVGEAASD